MIDTASWDPMHHTRHCIPRSSWRDHNSQQDLGHPLNKAKPDIQNMIRVLGSTVVLGSTTSRRWLDHLLSRGGFSLLVLPMHLRWSARGWSSSRYNMSIVLAFLYSHTVIITSVDNDKEEGVSRRRMTKALICRTTTILMMIRTLMRQTYVPVLVTK